MATPPQGVTFDFSTAKPLSQGPPSGVTFDFSTAQPIEGAPNAGVTSQIEDQGYTPTAFKWSDLNPFHEDTFPRFLSGAGSALVNTAEGLGHAAMHPVQAVSNAGSAGASVVHDLHERQYLSALIDTIGAFGFDEKRAARLWSQGNGAQAVGEMTPNAGLLALSAEAAVPKSFLEGVNPLLRAPAVLGTSPYFAAASLPERLAQIPKTLTALKQFPAAAADYAKNMLTSAGRRALLLSATHVRDVVGGKLADETEAAYNAGKSHASRLYNGINAADEADITERGLKVAGISTKPLLEGIIEAKNQLQQVGQRMPAAQGIESRISALPERLTFEQLKQLRSDLNELYPTGSNAQKAIFARTMDKITDVMKTRATGLEQPAQFAAANKIWQVLESNRESGPLGKILSAKDSGELFSYLFKRGVQAKLKILENTLAPYGLSPEIFENTGKAVQGIHNFIEHPISEAVFGIFRKAIQHPIATIAGFEGGGIMGGWYGRIAGAWAAASMAERITVLNALKHLGIEPDFTSLIAKESQVLPKAPLPKLPVKGGATIREQLTAKGRPTPVVSGAPIRAEELPAPSPFNPAEKAELEQQAGHALSDDDAIRLLKANRSRDAVSDQLAGNKHTIEDIAAIRQEGRLKSAPQPTPVVAKTPEEQTTQDSVAITKRLDSTVSTAQRIQQQFQYGHISREKAQATLDQLKTEIEPLVKRQGGTVNAGIFNLPDLGEGEIEVMNPEESKINGSSESEASLEAMRSGQSFRIVDDRTGKVVRPVSAIEARGKMRLNPHQHLERYEPAVKNWINYE